MRVAHASGARHVAKPAAVVVVEDIRSKVGQIEIDAPVVVVIAGTRADSVQTVLDPSRIGDVFEEPVTTIPVEPGFCPRVDFGIDNRSAIDQEDIDPAVAVVVEEEATRAHGLHDVLRGTRTVGVCECQTRFGRDVSKLGGVDCSRSVGLSGP